MLGETNDYRHIELVQNVGKPPTCCSRALATCRRVGVSIWHVKRGLIVLLLCLALLSGSAVLTGAAVTQAEYEKPNIVYIVADDMDENLLFEGMPATKEAVADRGATLTDFNVTDSVCCPSRATALLGEYVHNHGVVDSTGPNGGYTRFLREGHDGRTLGPMLRNQGYATAMVGKYLNEYGPKTDTARRVPPGWAYWFAVFNQKKYGWEANEQGRVVRYGTSPAAYSTTAIFRKARSWIAKQDGPFFAHVSPIAPHSPYVDPPDHQREFAGARAPSRLKPNFNEDVSDKPSHVLDNPALSKVARNAIDARHVHRARMTLAVDDTVKGIVDALETSGELDNTYIFVTSDNGWQAGEHRIPSEKLYPYEESTRVGMLVSGPGITPGTKVPQITSNTDLYATFADIAGKPEPRDGRSLLPLLRGEVPEGGWRERLLIENPAPPDNRNHASYFGLKDERWKYVEYAKGERELYDLYTDPYETENLAGQRSETEANLSARLDTLKNCSGDSCRTAENGP